MKRITYTPGIEAMQGSLSPKQTLLYAKNNNPAYFSPVGSKNGARNYRPQFIAMRRTADGANRFASRSRYAINMTPAAKRAMALLGASAAIYALFVKNETRPDARYIYEYHVSIGDIPAGTTFRQYWMGRIRYMLTTYMSDWTEGVHTSGGDQYSVTIPNCYMNYSNDYKVSDNLRIKFWEECQQHPVMFTVDGLQGIGVLQDTYGDLLQTDYNVLGLTRREVSDTEYVRYQGMFLKKADGSWVTGDAYITNGDKLHTTTESPS